MFSNRDRDKRFELIFNELKKVELLNTAENRYLIEQSLNKGKQADSKLAKINPENAVEFASAIATLNNQQIATQINFLRILKYPHCPLDIALALIELKKLPKFDDIAINGTLSVAKLDKNGYSSSALVAAKTTVKINQHLSTHQVQPGQATVFFADGISDQDKQKIMNMIQGKPEQPSSTCCVIL